MDEIADLAQRLQARGRWINRVRQKIMDWHDLIESEQDLDDSAGDGISVRDVLLKEMSDFFEGPRDGD